MAAGFIVRNAVDAGSVLDLAEPDALDFNLLGRPRYGVLTMGATGTDPVALSGWNATVPVCVVLVNDVLVSSGGQVTLQTSSQQPRFDLVGIDQGGAVVSVRGTPSPNPVYPDYGDTVTILAAVYITPGTTPPDAVRDITDKRRFVQRRFLSDVTSGDLLASYASTPALVEQFSLSAQGAMRWALDTTLARTAAKTLQVSENLNVTKVLTADSATIAHGLTVGGDISAANLLKGAGAPATTGAVGTLGDLYQDQTNGGLWSYESTGWGRLSTVPIPPGYVMASLGTTEPDGWLKMDGRSVDKPTSGGLWNAFPAWRIDASNLRLPNAQGMFLRQGTPVGSGQDGGAATATLQVANMPAHTHIDKDTGGTVTTAAGGTHTHTGTVSPGGDHEHTTDPNQGHHHHDTYDPQHFHAGADGGAGGSFVAASWGGTRRLDGPFNDASHPVAVELVANTVPSPTYVQVVDGGTHSHVTNHVPPHSHPVTIDPFNSTHTHGIPERSVGGGQSFPILPPYMAVTYLIKT